MDQNQRENLRAKWVAEKKNKKKITIISVVCTVVFIIILITWAVVAINNEKNKQKAVVAAPDGITTFNGLEMHNKCLAKFKDFVSKYGQDYSKCLVDFNFGGEYCSGSQSEGLSDANIIVILDSSGSMADQMGGSEKIDIAKTAVSNFLTKLPPGVNTGLIVYGHKGSNSTADKSLSCKGIEEIVKLGKNNNSNIISAMKSFNPKGWTPIAGSLDFVKNIFLKNGTNSKNYLILVSDGAESCDGDPLSSAEELKLAVPGTKLNVIGFTSDIKTQDFLQRVADLGSGNYLTAANSYQIAKAFNDELLLIKKDCITVTLFQTSSEYNANKLNDLNCWLDAHQKEINNFTINVSAISNNAECNLEISNALQARQNEFWVKKQALIDKNDAVYKQIEIDLNKQLEILNKPQN